MLLYVQQLSMLQMQGPSAGSHRVWAEMEQHPQQTPLLTMHSARKGMQLSAILWTPGSWENRLGISDLETDRTSAITRPTASPSCRIRHSTCRAIMRLSCRPRHQSLQNLGQARCSRSRMCTD